jgi:hypothetical protein
VFLLLLLLLATPPIGAKTFASKKNTKTVIGAIKKCYNLSANMEFRGLSRAQFVWRLAGPAKPSKLPAAATGATKLGLKIRM